MKIDYLGSKVSLSSGPKTGRDDGTTGKPKLELLGSQVDLGKTPVNDFKPEASKSTFQMMGETVPLSKTASSPYESDMSTRAKKQQGSGR